MCNFVLAADGTDPAELDLTKTFLSFADLIKISPTAVEELSRQVVEGRRNTSLQIEHLVTWDVADSFDSYMINFTATKVDFVMSNLGIDTFASSSMILPMGFDCDDDGITGAGDLACVATIAERDEVLAALANVPGDLDGSGAVNFQDFLQFSRNFGVQEASYVEGNIDLEEGVGFPDFVQLSKNFGFSSASNVSSFPEPTSLFPAILAGVGQLAGRHLRFWRD